MDSDAELIVTRRLEWVHRMSHTMALGLCVGLSLVSAQTGSAPADSVQRTGEAIAKEISAQWGAMPADWVRDSNVMDPIWAPLGYAGVNYYAFGGPARQSGYASRSDPASANYQAWFGVYVVVPALGSAAEPVLGVNQAISLAEHDQLSWLGAMGDPHPLALTLKPIHASRIAIDGAQRTLYSFDMKSHSDLGPGTTPLAKIIGMPRPDQHLGLRSFHAVTLHIIMALWYDRQRHVEVVSYGASTRFRDSRGHLKDTGPALRLALAGMMSGVRLTG